MIENIVLCVDIDRYRAVLQPAQHSMEMNVCGVNITTV